MILPYDIHTVILSKIYSVEDHINYCEAFNIDCHFNLCDEIKDSRYGYGELLKKYITLHNNKYIIIYEYQNKITTKICKESIYFSLAQYGTFILSDDLHILFNNKEIHIIDYMTLVNLQKYLHRAKKNNYNGKFI